MEPKLHPDNEAKAYGVIKEPYLGNGTSTIPTVFHMIFRPHPHRSLTRGQSERMSDAWLAFRASAQG